MDTLTTQQIQDIAAANGFEYAALKAVIMCEGSGHGYDQATGKILIRFEPAWYRRLDGAVSGDGVWDAVNNGSQTNEWTMFNDAFKKDADAAMQGTSWGMMQVMGFHYKDLDFASVGEMVDYAKASEANQVDLGVRFIKKSTRLNDALVNLDWKTFAYYYNGPKYAENKYDEHLATHYAAALT